jgi:hypothetical protein
MRLLRGLLCAVVALIAAVAIWWTWVDWHGAHRWHEVQAMFAREGQPLDFRATAPDPIPDAENFCAIPLLKDIALAIDDDIHKGEPGEKRARLNAATLPDWNHSEPPTMAGASLGQRADLKQWAAWMRKYGPLSAPADSADPARDLLAASSKQDAVFAGLAGGLDRPHGQWTPPWKTRALRPNLASIAIPHYRSAIDLNHTLALRGIAAARAGDASKAHESLQIMARLDQACLEEPLLIGFLVAAAGTTDLANATWELCDAQAGTVEDFRRLESALAAMDFRRSICRAIGSDLAADVSMLQLTKKTARRPQFSPLYGQIPTRHPAGFIDANTAELADRGFVYLVKPIRDRGWQAAFVSARKLEAEFAGLHEEAKARPFTFFLTHPSVIMADMFLPAIPNSIYRAIYAQTLANQAMIACALERYRIEKGSYPELLDNVRLADGKPLPVEVLTGKPMSYRKTANGKYALWSSGFDEKNHGGQRAFIMGYPEQYQVLSESYAGDWVWDFPEK